MKLWNSVKRLFSPEPVVVQKPAYDDMVGEPVISFLEALKREPRRFRVKQGSYGTFPVSEFQRYPWMTGADILYWKLIDRKTGREYPAIILDRKLYAVYSLPFSLNHWELRAIEVGLADHRLPARERRDRIVSTRWTRERLAEVAAESLARETFAWQFREGGR